MTIQILYLTLFAILCAIQFASSALAQTDASSAPQVIATQPVNGATDVAPEVKEVVVTFDQNMDRGGFPLWVAGRRSQKFVARHPGALLASACCRSS